MEQAMKRMMVHDIHHLPVAEPDHPELMLGFLTQSDVMQIYCRSCKIIDTCE
jgi:CBS-domain-containing membrane protein